MFSTRPFFFLKLKEEKSTQEIERTGKSRRQRGLMGDQGGEKSMKEAIVVATGIHPSWTNYKIFHGC
jgi:hypothetical protein